MTSDSIAHSRIRDTYARCKILGTAALCLPSLSSTATADQPHLHMAVPACRTCRTACLLALTAPAARIKQHSPLVPHTHYRSAGILPGQWNRTNLLTLLHAAAAAPPAQPSGAAWCALFSTHLAVAASPTPNERHFRLYGHLVWEAGRRTHTTTYSTVVARQRYLTWALSRRAAFDAGTGAYYREPCALHHHITDKQGKSTHLAYYTFPLTKWRACYTHAASFCSFTLSEHLHTVYVVAVLHLLSWTQEKGSRL